MRGPIDYIIVGFKGNNFDGSVLRAVAGAVESGAIALVALSAISKGQDGLVTILDIADMGDAYVVQLAESSDLHNDLITSEDIEEVADLLEEDTTAGLLIVEQLWAKPLKKALIDANGFLLAEGRIHPEAALELEESEV